MTPLIIQFSPLFFHSGQIYDPPRANHFLTLNIRYTIRRTDP